MVFAATLAVMAKESNWFSGRVIRRGSSSLAVLYAFSEPRPQGSGWDFS
jgi:hypothetical protein